MSTDPTRSTEQSPKEIAEAKAMAFLQRVNRWHEKHATTAKQPECPICSGIEWVFVAEPAKIGTVTVHPRYCTLCGYTMLVNAALLG
jgi:hypothetical protein